MTTALRTLGTLLPACLLATASHGQLLWQQAMGTAAYDETSSAFLPVPGGYVNVGGHGGNGRGALPNKFYLAKLDAAGTVLWQKSPSMASRNVQVMEQLGAAANAAGELYATGICTELVALHPASPYSFGLLVKFSPAGDTLWSRVLHGINRSDYSQIVVTADGGAVVIGSNDNDEFIAKFSSSGQELWHRSYTYNNIVIGYLQSIVQTTGGFLVANAPNCGCGVPWKYLVLDAQGQKITEKPAPYRGYYSMQTNLAGNILAGAGRFYKISATGDTLWSRQYTQYGRKVEVRLATPVPGTSNYLLAGTRSNSVDEDLSLLLVDQNGTRLRDTLLIRYGGNEWPTGLSVDAQGNYLVGGYTSDTGPIGRADQFALKLRNWNRLLPTRPATGPATAYQLYPNPATGVDQLRVATESGQAYTGAYELRDLTGRLLQAGTSWPSQGLPLRGRPTGLYLLRLREGERWLPALRLACR